VTSFENLVAKQWHPPTTKTCGKEVEVEEAVFYKLVDILKNI
jgi:hypothetical protein